MARIEYAEKCYKQCRSTPDAPPGPLPPPSSWLDWRRPRKTSCRVGKVQVSHRLCVRRTEMTVWRLYETFSLRACSSESRLITRANRLARRRRLAQSSCAARAFSAACLDLLCAFDGRSRTIKPIQSKKKSHPTHISPTYSRSRATSANSKVEKKDRSSLSESR